MPNLDSNLPERRADDKRIVSIERVVREQSSEISSIKQLLVGFDGSKGLIEQVYKLDKDVDALYHRLGWVGISISIMLLVLSGTVAWTT